MPHFSHPPSSHRDPQGVFTKELDTALLAKDVDIVVHCMKDLATTLPDGIEFCAVMQRGPVDDAVVLADKHRPAFLTAAQAASATASSSSSSASAGDGAAPTVTNTPAGLSLALSILPAGAVIGTSALRRQASLARHHAGLVCKDIRGNLGTR